MFCTSNNVKNWLSIPNENIYYRTLKISELLDVEYK